MYWLIRIGIKNLIPFVVYKGFKLLTNCLETADKLMLLRDTNNVLIFLINSYSCFRFTNVGLNLNEYFNGRYKGNL